MSEHRVERVDKCLAETLLLLVVPCRRGVELRCASAENRTGTLTE